MDEVIDIDAPVSTNGQAPEAPPQDPTQRPLKDYSNDELIALHKQIVMSRRRLNTDFNLVSGVLIGRGLDVDPED